MTARIFIDGAAGTTGLDIHTRLAGRSDIALMLLDDGYRKSSAARRDALNAADIAILCLPDDAAREAVALIDNPHTRVIDASTAHRIAPGWAYGFPEVIGHDVIATSARVSNPGCYATGFVALVAPLVGAGLIPADWPLFCNAVSGYSGGGKAMIADYACDDGAPAWSGYALNLAHKHVPEMQKHCGLIQPPLFAPAVVNIANGMVVEVPLAHANLPNAPGAVVISAALTAAYAGTAMVSIVEGAAPAAISIAQAAGTDRLDIFLLANEATGQMRLVAAFDNLGKGACGAAIQNLNIMLGLPETTGLLL